MPTAFLQDVLIAGIPADVLAHVTLGALIFGFFRLTGFSLVGGCVGMLGIREGDADSGKAKADSGHFDSREAPLVITDANAKARASRILELLAEKR